MEPLIKKKRQKFLGGDYVETADLSLWNNNSSNDIFEPIDINTTDFDDAFEAFDVNPKMTGDDEKRRIEALKRAIDIAKLMSNVTIESIIAIAENVDKYLRETL